MLVAKVFSDQAASSKSIRCTEAYSGDVGVPPVGGTFWFQIFIQAPSLEIWRKTISVLREVLAGKWGGLFLGYLLGKIFGGVIAIISFRPGGWMQQSAVPRCAILSVGSTEGIGQ